MVGQKGRSTRGALGVAHFFSGHDMMKFSCTDPDVRPWLLHECFARQECPLMASSNRGGEAALMQLRCDKGWLN